MRSIIVIISILFLTLGACQSPQARRPVKVNSGSFIEASVERNKKIYDNERTLFEALIEKDSTNDYITSESGFWYYYNTQDSLSIDKMPILGDAVTFTYNINDLDGNVIISEAENGIQNYLVDQSNQELISGIREGIKLLKVGESATFLFPSYKAYGYYGIEKKLGTNIPVTSTITLLSITQTEEN
ncbi:peptidyl-prolyl cis-trans isomerase [Patiriisocius marinistellae]|uniref:Peptidyl-prolyl cis-trans isomerase n=1 Tax=Patiriisocius marinistellae TaxID=2494560 RepID=A0A5J4FY21_9FLAO|nr:gliding motility-associated peptidyl-prolyl isomerase GldI [Patiriisocius marinistellae]GEQ86074.1 peptidyl-prolyl cis-trans isomerase [Patiriisocius marinistellae]